MRVSGICVADESQRKTRGATRLPRVAPEVMVIFPGGMAQTCEATKPRLCEHACYFGSEYAGSHRIRKQHGHDRQECTNERRPRSTSKTLVS